MGGKRHPLKIYRKAGRPFGSCGGSKDSDKGAGGRAPRPRRRKAKPKASGRRAKSTQGRDPGGGWSVARLRRLVRSAAFRRRLAHVSRIALGVVLLVGFLYTAWFWLPSGERERESSPPSLKVSRDWPDRLAKDRAVLAYWVQVASGEVPKGTGAAAINSTWGRDLRRLTMDLAERFPEAEVELFQVMLEDSTNDGVLLCAGARVDPDDLWLQELLEWALLEWPGGEPQLVRLPEPK